MTGTDIARRNQTGTDLAVPQGARQLGARVKPIIRLGMGVKVEGQRRDGTTYTRPDKTDHFTIRGDQRAITKFQREYGEKPKAVKIMVPSSMSLALDISYRAFIGGGDGDGRPLALGMTNFATLGYVGGPDVLRVWKQDGTYAEIETLGLDELGKPLDDTADQLGIEVYTTFTFTIPNVLGWGSFAQVTSKGKKSADNLTFKLGEIYSAFGHRAPFAFSKDEPPLLVLKPDTALTRFEDRQTKEARWGKTQIFVLDIVIPESFDEMSDRITTRQRELASVNPTEALYGASHDRPALMAADPADDPATTTAGPSTESSAGVGGGTVPTLSPVDDAAADYETVEDVEVVDDELEQAAAEAAMFVPPGGVHGNAGRTLQQIHHLDSGGGTAWFRIALGKDGQPAPFRAALRAYTQVNMPDLYAELFPGHDDDVQF